eukprot:TRINITY_DN5625_c4_g1_i1.p1 TRINITY_DN5625_c4_g1~~TRINITY_DN5625_c4_g1_i1.p1  ORF type:complete len:289 (+),score=153.47 TRINITY_DN5625_c4_g1_i1:59-925(+)
MARNEEKSQSMLNRYLQMKAEAKQKPKRRRPRLATDCNSLVDAEKWRIEILREIGHKVAEIQNEGLTETTIRELNDRINKLIREKYHWERQIVELGGPNYTANAPKIFDDDDGLSAAGSSYRYFGAAKKLPGVEHLLPKNENDSKKHEQISKRTRAEIAKSIDIDYYGWRDEDDGIIVKLETEVESTEFKKLVEQFKDSKKQKMLTANSESKQNTKFYNNADSDDDEEKDENESKRNLQPLTNLPTKEQIEAAIIDKRKQDLIKRYVSNILIEEQKKDQDHVRSILGK